MTPLNIRKGCHCTPSMLRERAIAMRESFSPWGRWPKGPDEGRSFTLTRRFAAPSPRESVAKLGICSLLKLELSCRRAPTGTDSEFCNTLQREKDLASAPPAHHFSGWCNLTYLCAL